ncbi:MAG: S-layer homology domain-containing protein [Clostridia bacterium]|nr:S-layer homology domain-containing protein [Clostridia bacterium]
MKKQTKKALAVITAAALSVTMSISAFAAKFPDVTEKTYPWAIEAIESMADEGIIKGYEDGTFNPAKTVSKLESLVLISRILGVNNEKTSRITEAAWDVYGEDIAEYELPYGKDEIAYLLGKNVLSVDELEEYIDAAHRDDALKRYEVAILLTKAMDAEASLKAELAAELSYADTSDIPANAKKYVAYVSEQELMQGMEDNKFAPNDTVTRAQAAVVLYKLQQITDYEFKTGVVSAVDQTTRQIKIKVAEDNTLSHYITADTIVRYNGAIIGINDIAVGYDAVVTYKAGKLYSVDFTDALVDDVIKGAFSGSANSTAKGTTVTVNVIGENDTNISSEKTTFKLSDECVITYNNNTCSLTSIKAGSYVKLTVKKGLVTVLEAESKENTFSGRVDEVILEPVYKLRIEANGGETGEYLLNSEVKVTRNGKAASAREVLAGDTVSVTTSYGIIKSLVATSRSAEKTGIIKEVIISSTPKLTLTYDGVDTTYYVTADAEITLSGVKSTFYDLRVGQATTIELDSDTVISIKSAANDEVITWAGTVTLVNSSYGLIQLEFTDATTGQTRTESVFVKDKATIVDYATQKTKKLSAITAGMKINVTGTMQTGLFEANTIIIIG